MTASTTPESRSSRHARRIASARRRRSRGVATLTVASVLVLVITVSTLFVSRSQLFDLKSSSNHYRYTQAFEMAERGLEQTVAWLQTRVAIPDDQNPTCASGQVVPIRWATWGCGTGQTAAQCSADVYEYLEVPAAAAVNHCNAGYPSLSGTNVQALGDANFDVNITVRRKKGLTSDRYRFDIISQAQTTGGAGDPYRSLATVRQSVLLHPLPGRVIPANPGAPILVRNTVSITSGSSKVCSVACPEIEYYGVATLQSNTSAFDSRTLTFLANNSILIRTLDALEFTVFEILFRGATLCEIERLSRLQKAAPPPGGRNVYFYGSGGCTTTPEALGNSLPTFPIDNPGIVVVASDAYSGPNACPKPNNDRPSYGVYYFGKDCNGNGWGGVLVNGVVGVEGSLYNMTGSVSMDYSGTTHTGTNDDTLMNFGNLPPGRLARIPGSWRDF